MNTMVPVNRTNQTGPYTMPHSVVGTPATIRLSIREPAKQPETVNPCQDSGCWLCVVRWSPGWHSQQASVLGSSV